MALVLLVVSRPGQSLAGPGAKHDFTQWENEISAFERMDRTNPPPKGGVLFIGSSTIRFWKSLPQDFPGRNVINRGFGGSELEDSTHFADRIIFPYEPSMVFIRAGGNDLWAGKSVAGPSGRKPPCKRRWAKCCARSTAAMVTGRNWEGCFRITRGNHLLPFSMLLQGITVKDVLQEWL